VRARRVTPTGVLAAPADLPEDEWLAMRRTGIGGSDVGALLGMSKYTSPYELYLDKRGELPDMPRPEGLERAARWGHLHEPLLAAEFARQHNVTTRRVGLIRHETEAWRLANLDRQVLGCPDGPCLLEIKNRSAYKAGEWGETGDPDGVPDTEALQTHWYMAVTGYRHAHVAVLINGNDDRYYRVDGDDQIAGDVTDMARSFWQRIQDGTPPPVDGSQATTELLACIYEGDPDKEIVVAPGEAEALRQQRAEILDREAAIAIERAEVENRMREILGEAEIAICDGAPAFTWKRNGVFAAKRFREAEPELAAQYTHMVPAIDTKALAAGHPDIYRAHRARVLRVSGGSK
jgi:putative phage-type endonuclease